MSVDAIISNAKDSRYTGMRYNARLQLYESYKRDIARLDISGDKYTQAIRRLTDVLGV